MAVWPVNSPLDHRPDGALFWGGTTLLSSLLLVSLVVGQSKPAKPSEPKEVAPGVCLVPSGYGTTHMPVGGKCGAGEREIKNRWGGKAAYCLNPNATKPEPCGNIKTTKAPTAGPVQPAKPAAKPPKK